LDWKRALGIRLWYSSSAAASVQSVLSDYEVAVVHGEAAPSVPWYIEVR